MTEHVRLQSQPSWMYAQQGCTNHWKFLKMVGH